ncbi:MAG: hypothetical protein H6624_04090 [Bdellovibrionaceae bacterium]|nr:hypothetical protein [Bdellovibrionales bacterium]MCB9083495.1 hypothetical protein [Pseudobdellovibrionaceae bacterium]
MDEVVTEFKSESQEILARLTALLEDLEEDPGRVNELDGYGQKVDRIMGGAMSLASAMDNDPLLNQIGACAGLCKTVGYRGSQIPEEQGGFAKAVIGLLLDMTEMLQTMVEKVGSEKNFDLSSPLYLTVVDRLKWVSEQFQDGTRSSLKIAGTQGTAKDFGENINDLLKRMGVS